PLLTARGTPQPRTQPLRVIVDSRAALSRTSRLVQSAREVPVLVFCTDDAAAKDVAALEDAGVRVQRVGRRNGRVDLRTVLSVLYDTGVHALLCEGGGAVAAELLALGLVDRLHAFIAPRFF